MCWLYIIKNFLPYSQLHATFVGQLAALLELGVYRNSGKTPILRQQCGCKKTTLDERDWHQLARIVSHDRCATLTAEFNNHQLEDCATFRSWYGFYRADAQVPLMNAQYTAMCLTWALEHCHWTLDNWKQVAWYKESGFQLFWADGWPHVWQKPHEAMDPSCQYGTVQAGGGSVMVCDLFNWHSMGPLVCLGQVTAM